MSNQVLQELSRLSINITKCEEAATSWHESCLFVLAEKGLHIFEFSHNLQCFDKKIDCVQSFIGNPKSSPVSSLFTNRVLNKDLRNIEQTEMIVDHSLWPHNPQLLQEMSTIVDFKVSPVGTVNSQDSAVALMTNVGVVEIHKQNLFNWTCALEISTQLCLESGLSLHNPKDFSMLKATVHTLATSAICWSPTVNQDNSCYFITTQKNGNIIIWLIHHIGKNITAKIQGSFSSDTCEIMSIVWIQSNADRFLLVCSNILGQIIIYKCEIQNDVFQLIDSNIIWSHKDRMISNQLQYLEMQNKLVLVFNKHRHLGVLIIKKDGTVLGEYIKNINDYRITSITKSSDGIHVTIVNCKIYKLDLSFVDSELVMNLSLVECQDLIPSYELYSMSHSQNNIMYALSMVDRKVYFRKGELKIEIFLMSRKEKLDSILDVLISNPTKQLTHYWDIVEVLRYKTMKTKEAPCIDYNQLYEMACSDAYMLKVYLIFCTLCYSLKKLCKISPQLYLPEDSVNIVKEEVLVAHADEVIQTYSKKYQEENMLEEYEIEYFLGAKKFLEYFFQKSRRNLSEVMDLKILNKFDRDFSYMCQCCDEEVIGFTCKNEHLNMFCALTFTPIHDSSYLICKWCNLTARKEMYSENPLCLFCDVNLYLINE